MRYEEAKRELLKLFEARKKIKVQTAVRGSLTEFARFCGFEPAPHHQLLIKHLEALDRGEFGILLVEMPPGSAKSTYINFLFLAWSLLRNPTLQVLTASHSASLAEQWGRRTRNLMADIGPQFGCPLAEDNQSSMEWATQAGGRFQAAGVDKRIAGIRADLAVIDDPFGLRTDAESKTIRDNVWRWYLNDFNSRLTPTAKRAIMHTRWHDDDLASRVKQQLQKIGRPYVCLTLPAEALENDPLGRQPGELLWDDPGGYDYGRYLRDRKEESDTYTWASLYQQNPVPDAGAYFNRDWLRPVPSVPMRGSLRVYGASDYAVTANGGDYTVHIVVGIGTDARLYVLDLWRGQTDSAEWIDAWCDLVLKWRPIEWAEEGGQIRASIGPFLERRAVQRRAYTFRRQFPSRHDKAVRAQSIRARMSMLGLYVPESAPWRADFEAELMRFPAGVHDDQVDALGLIGQLLDHIQAPLVPEKPKARNLRPDWFAEPEEAELSWKVA